jgi:hypothetical protein
MKESKKYAGFSSGKWFWLSIIVRFALAGW